MDSVTANLSIGKFLGNYRIESIISNTPEYIDYLAEDMRKSIQIWIRQFAQDDRNQLNDPEQLIEKNTMDYIQKNPHPNMVLHQEILSENGFNYVVFPKPNGISLDEYLTLIPILSEIEVNNLLSTLLSIFIFLAKHDCMVGDVSFRQIYRDDTGKYILYGVLPFKKQIDFNSHYITIINKIIESLVVFDNEASNHFSKTFKTLIKRISSQQFKTIDELTSLFKISGKARSNIDCEPVVCYDKTFNEKYFYLALFIGVTFFAINWMTGNSKNINEYNTTSSDKSKRVPKDNETLAIKTIEYDSDQPQVVTLQPTEPVEYEKDQLNNIKSENESIHAVVRNDPFIPTSTDKYIDYGEYIKDKRTGLLWQKDGITSGKLNFYQAKEYANKLRLGNVKGWRVPTIKELESIFPALEKPFINTPYTDQKCCKGPYEWHSYWTSEMDKSLPDYAFVYEWYQFGEANNCYASKNYDYVRCVHDPL